jgi:hypothetical protein
MLKSLKLRRKKEIEEKEQSKPRKRRQIEKDFIDNETVVLRIPLSEAIIRNQRLILETLLDIRDNL